MGPDDPGRDLALGTENLVVRGQWLATGATPAPRLMLDHERTFTREHGFTLSMVAIAQPAIRSCRRVTLTAATGVRNQEPGDRHRGLRFGQFTVG